MTNTQLTQMALSAIIRCKEQINVFELSNVLCGKSTRAIRKKDLIKSKHMVPEESIQSTNGTICSSK